MSPRPILLVGGTGKVGRWTARLLREEHPQIRFLIGGRNLEKAEEFARELGSAEAVPIDLTASDLGLGDRQVGAVAVFFTEDRLATVRFAQSRSVPHISISRALFEIGPEIAYFTQRPSTSPVVLGTEWLVGATTMPILSFAKAFGKIERISIGALLDEEDATGPAGFADFDRQNAVMPSALIRRSGEFHWLTGDKVKTSFNAADGTQTEATAFSVNDVIGLAAALDVPDIEFKLAIGTTSSRRRGKHSRRRSSSRWKGRTIRVHRYLPIALSPIRSGRCRSPVWASLWCCSACSDSTVKPRQRRASICPISCLSQMHIWPDLSELEA